MRKRRDVKLIAFKRYFDGFAPLNPSYTETMQCSNVGWVKLVGWVKRSAPNNDAERSSELTPKTHDEVKGGIIFNSCNCRMPNLKMLIKEIEGMV
jgi:hypothetical protein